MFNVVKFCKDYHITPVERGKHYREGWVNIDCPFCGGRDGHLGVHISTGAVKCWKCGKHSQVEVIKYLLELDYDSAITIQEHYSDGKAARLYTGGTKNALGTKVSKCEWPTGTTELQERHIKYLEGRNFDAYKLEDVWGLRGTNNIGDYKFRVIAPIFVNHKMVSYQGRDVTGKSALRYKACEASKEVTAHQSVVYGIDLVVGRACVVVEGITDCWRLGAGAVCCFGIAFTVEQINMIAERMETVYILFDTEDQAQKQAKEMACMLSASGVEVELLELGGGDPAEMSQEEADELMIELNLK